MFGGCLSFILMVGFAVVFATSFYDVLTKVSIESSSNSQDNPDSVDSISNIQFAIGIDGLVLGDGSARKFTFILEALTSVGPNVARTQIHLKPCKLMDWKDIGNHFEKQFSAFGMSNMLCPQQD